jgi:hypothetical protein
MLGRAALSNDVPVSGPGEGNGRGTPAEGTPTAAEQTGEQASERAGVLANLPRTRPQRASPRRDAARRNAAGEKDDLAAANGNGRPARKSTPKKAGATRAGTSARGAGAAKTKPRPKAARPRRRETEEVPRQGYESVEDRATGPVQPPGGTEFVGTAAEIVSELAKAGISGGERVVRDLLSRLGR